MRRIPSASLKMSRRPAAAALAWRRALLIGTSLALALPGAALAQRVGTTAAVNPVATGTPPGAAPRVLTVGNDVQFEERIETSTEGQTQILFVDQSSLTVGPGATVVLDRFVYDPATGRGDLALSVTKGVFRFIGGRISNSSGATIRTPTATLGIRGTALFGQVGETGDDAVPERFIFASCGEQCSISTAADSTSFGPSANGSVFGVGGSGGQIRYLGKATDAILRSISRALEGSGGGGQTQPLTVARAQQALSQGSPSEILSPTDFSASDFGSVAARARARHTATEVVFTRPERAVGVEQVVERLPVDEMPVEEPPPPPTGALTGRILATPDEGYPLDSGGSVTDPYTQSFVGGPDPRFSPAVEKGEIEDGRFRGLTAEATPQLIDLPAPPPPGSDSLSIFPVAPTLPGGAADTTPFGSFVGVGLYDSDVDFVAYLGFTLERNELNGGLYAFAGIPTPNKGNIASTGLQLSRYDLLGVSTSGGTPNLTINAPFLPTELSSQFATLSSSGLYILRRSTGNIGDAGEPSRAVFAALAIEGQGANQKSMVMVSDGRLIVEGDGLGIAQGVRGSVRTDAGGDASAISASVGSVPDGKGNHFFGPDLEYVTLSNNCETCIDNTTPGRDYGATYVTSLQGTSATNGFVNLAMQTSSSETIGTRSNRTLQGYAAVLGESQTGGTVNSPYVMRSEQAGDVRVTTNPSLNSVAATINVADVSADPSYASRVASARVEFGSTNGGFRGAFIDDQRFATRNAQDRGGELRLDNGTAATPATSPGNVDRDFSAAIVSAGMVPTPNILPQGVEFCRCDFLSWGYWSADFASANGDRDRFHIGTWVAGDLPDLVDIPTTGVASYRGHIIGNVYNSGDQYVAVGDYRQTYDFGSRSGNVTIGSFDGRNYSGNVSATATNRRDFSGSVDATDRGAVLNGSFVRNGSDTVGGVIGSASFTDKATKGRRYRASATFAAGKLPRNVSNAAAGRR